MEKFTNLKIGKINENLPEGIIPGVTPGVIVPPPPNPNMVGNPNQPVIVETQSEPAKFVSKLFEARQMTHIFHLKATGDGAYAIHMALDAFYNGILELNDSLIEVYQGQYDIIENYEVINGEPSAQNPIEYLIQLAEFIKGTRQIAFLAEDTHLQNIIDEIVALTYRTLYKLKNLK